jgi:hypothetical protein
MDKMRESLEELKDVWIFSLLEEKERRYKGKIGDCIYLHGGECLCLVNIRSSIQTYATLRKLYFASFPVKSVYRVLVQTNGW